MDKRQTDREREKETDKKRKVKHNEIARDVEMIELKERHF